MDTTLEALRTRFDENPGDARAFEALEEGYFLAGEWSKLVAIYEQRLAAPAMSADPHANGRTGLLLRLGQVLEDRCQDPAGARQRYEEAAQLDPSSRPALAQLRRLHAQANRWDRYLALAQQEMGLPMRPFERAAFFTEVGEVWLRRLGDPQQAVAHFENALEADPTHANALLGVAAAQKRLHAPDLAAAALERAIERLRGRDRAPALVSLGHLYQKSLEQPDRALEAYERALRDDPNNDRALEALAERAADDKRWDQYDEFQEARYQVESDSIRRLAVAHEAGRVQLEEHGEAESARRWFDRALELFPDDPMVHLYLADVERLAGNQQALGDHLHSAATLAADAAPTDLLQESALHAAREGNDEFAVQQLERALARDPDDSLVRADLMAALERLGRDDELIEMLSEDAETAPAGSPEQVAAWLRVGSYHEKRLGDRESARSAYERAFSIDAGSDAAALALGRALTAAADWEGLRRLYRQVVELPSVAQARRAGAWCELGDLAIARFEDLDGAQRAFQAALSLDASSPRGREGLERVALALGDDDALLTAFEREARATTDRDRLSFLVWELARIHRERDDPESALSWLERLVQASPEDIQALEGCARWQETLGRGEALCATLERLDPLLAGDPQTKNRKRLALAWRALGEPGRAIEACRAVLEISPDDLETLFDLDALLANARRRDELVEIRRNLAGLLQGEERIVSLDALARLLDERGDTAAAADAWAAAVEHAAPADLPEDVGPRLEALLATLGRWEALAARLGTRREGLDPLDPRAFALDVARAEILLERQGDAAGAIELFDLARVAEPHSERARDGLEKALRLAGQAERLVVLLEERARDEADAGQRAVLLLERAALLDESLEQLSEAKSVLAEVVEGGSEWAGEAEQRLLGLLERSRDWSALCERKRAQLGRGGETADLTLHLELAGLCQDRLGDRSAATLHLEAAAELAPERAETWQQLALLHEQDGNAAAWARALEAELSTDPEDERAVLLHARVAELCLGDLDDETRAEEHFLALLAIDSSHARSAEFLTERYERDERHQDLVELLEQRVSVFAGDASAGNLLASLRLRIAALWAGPLAQPSHAIETLETALEAPGAESTLAILAEPLADLYEREDRRDQMIELARRAVAACEAPEERAPWSLRIADALAQKGDDAAAADAYRQTLVDRPEDRGAQCALRELYRKLAETEPLVRLLEAELARVGGPPEIPLRMELAGLLSLRLERPEDAFVHLRRVLQLAPDHAAAGRRALELATSLDRHEDALELLDLTLALTHSPLPRSDLLARRGALQASMSQPAAALRSLREAAALDPSAAGLNIRIRELLRNTGDWRGVLACLESETARLPTADRSTREDLIEEGAALAKEHFGADEALPWLARLRALRPDDGALLAGIAEIHRAAGRTEPLLRALEDELAACPTPTRRAELESERARLFETENRAPGRAIAAWQAVREADPGARESLVELERLYRETGRERERLGVLTELLEGGDAPERLSWRRSAAEAARGLGDLTASTDHLWRALSDATEGIDRVELLRELEELWPQLGRRDLWARVAEAELACLDPEAPVFAERRRELHEQLASAYRLELARPDKAMAHLRVLLDREADAGSDREAEDCLLVLLRRAGETIELEARLSARLEGAGDAGGASDWLELARLRHQRLHHLSGAALAYRRVLELDPSCLDALRGLRDCVSRLGRAEEVADSLERELALRPDAEAPERAALYRRLGEITWRELDSTTRASRAFAAALEADPADRVSLRSLQALFETMEDWRGAADLYESEVSVLGDDDPQRRQEAWLRVGAIARDRLEDQDRAIASYEAAAELAPLALNQRREWADLYEQAGRSEQHAVVLASWVDAEGSGATVADHLRLAQTLEALGRREPALARVEHALALAPEHRDAWDTAARLREQLGHGRDAALAYERAAGCTQGTEAARRRLAASLHATSEEERARLLDRATADDPGCAEAHARLAVASARIGQIVQAERAALRALELEACLELPEALVLEMALAGGRAARAQEHGPQALGLFEAALRIDEDHAEALAGHGEVALQQGDFAVARISLSRLVERENGHADRAVHLTRLGQALQAEGESSSALRRFQEALAMDERLDDAHRGLTELLEREGRIDQAVDALQTWAVRSDEPELRAGRLMHAARLELDRADREEPAEALLREAVSVQPDHGEAWTLLCDLLWAQGRSTEALDQATRALDALGPVSTAAPAALVRGRALEQRGDQRDAADSFRFAMDVDSRCAEGALSAARLWRALGEWRKAADALQRFTECAPEDASDQYAPAYHQLGRLLAGPLEDLDGAIEVYHRALEADPTLEDARFALADLLVHRPKRWGDAVQQHLQILSADPLRLPSLRGLLQIARGRERGEGVAGGLAILRALGCATPEERVEAPSRLACANGQSPMSDPIGEALRRVACEIAEEIGEAFGVGATGEQAPPAPGADPVTRLRSAMIAAEGELCAPALVPLSNQELGAALTLAAQLSLEVDAIQGDGDLVNGFSQVLGRRVRRRVRKALGSVGAGDLSSIDWDAWRLELRAQAALRALESVDGELRSAFLAWLEEADEGSAQKLPPEIDLRDRIAGNVQARVFLERLIQHWSECL